MNIKLKKLSKILLIISEYLIYLLLIFLFMNPGNAFREIGIYIPPILLFLRAFILKENPVYSKNKIFILLILLCVSGIIASILSPEPFYSLKWFKKTYLKLFLVFIALTYIFQTSQKLERLSHLFVFLSFLFSCLLFYDFYIKVFLDSQDFGVTIREYIVPLEVFYPFIPLFIVSKRTKILKLLGVGLLLMVLIAVILTGSRGGWVSVFLGLTVWLIGYLYIAKKTVDIKKFIIIIFFTAFSVFIILSIISPPYLKGKIEQLQKGYTSLRKELVWPMAIDSYKELPLLNKIFGNGLGRMIYLEDYKKYYMEKFNKQPEISFSPHNIYLYTLYKQGIVGLLIFLSFFLVSFKILIKSLKIEQPYKMKVFALSLISLLTTFMIHGLVEDMRFIQLIFIIPLIGAYTRYLESVKNV